MLQSSDRSAPSRCKPRLTEDIAERSSPRARVSRALLQIVRRSGRSGSCSSSSCWDDLKLAVGVAGESTCRQANFPGSSRSRKVRCGFGRFEALPTPDSDSVDQATQGSASARRAVQHLCSRVSWHASSSLDTCQQWLRIRCSSLVVDLRDRDRCESTRRRPRVAPAARRDCDAYRDGQSSRTSIAFQDALQALDVRLSPRGKD